MADKIIELITRYPTEENVQELICALRASPGILSTPEARKVNLRPTVWKYLLTSQPCLNSVSEQSQQTPSGPGTAPSHQLTSPQQPPLERPPVEMTQAMLDALHRDCFVTEKFINESVCSSSGSGGSSEGGGGGEIGNANELCERLERVVLTLRKVPNSAVSKRIATFGYSSWVTSLATPFVCNKMNEADAVQCSLVVIRDYAPFVLSTDPEFLDK